MQAIPRTLAFFLGGMRTGGGMAWVGQTCSAFSQPATDNGYCEQGQGACAGAGRSRGGRAAVGRPALHVCVQWPAGLRAAAAAAVAPHGWRVLTCTAAPASTAARAAYCGHINGGFRWSGSQAANPAGVQWDIYCLAHEIGHSFGSIHTHEFSPRIDECGVTKPVVLPTCSSPSPFFSQGAGTIMSYCHSREPVYSHVVRAAV